MGARPAGEGRDNAWWTASDTAAAPGDPYITVCGRGREPASAGGAEAIADGGGTDGTRTGAAATGGTDGTRAGAAAGGTDGMRAGAAGGTEGTRTGAATGGTDGIRAGAAGGTTGMVAGAVAGGTAAAGGPPDPSGASSGARRMRYLKRDMGSTARTPSSSTSIEKLPRDSSCPLDRRTSRRACCHWDASKQRQTGSAPDLPRGLISTNQRMKACCCRQGGDTL